MAKKTDSRKSLAPLSTNVGSLERPDSPDMEGWARLVLRSILTALQPSKS
jgi:hypothetical protein